MAVLLITLILLFHLPLANANVIDGTCPEDNSVLTNEILNNFLENDLLQSYRVDINIDGLTLEDFTVLINPDNESVCSQIAADEFYTDSAIPVALTYYAIDDYYIVVIRFLYNDNDQHGNGEITLTSGPSGAIAVYNHQFEGLHYSLLN